MNKVLLTLTALFLSACSNQPASLNEKSTDREKASYFVGHQLGEALKSGVDDQNLDIEVFLQALRMAVAQGENSELPIDAAEMKEAQERHAQATADMKQIMNTENAEINLQKGNEYRDKNAQKEGVISLSSGVQYRVLTEGGTQQHPEISDTVTVHYHGTLINNEVFDSSVERGEPIDIPLERVIQGWKETLPLMSIGDKWEIVIPPELAYGERGAGSNVGPNETLIFEVELLGIPSKS